MVEPKPMLHFVSSHTDARSASMHASPHPPVLRAFEDLAPGLAALGTTHRTSRGDMLSPARTSSTLRVVTEGVACLSDSTSNLCVAMVQKDIPLGRMSPGTWLTDGALTEVPFQSIIETYGAEVAMAVCTRAADLSRTVVETELVCAIRHEASQRLARWMQPLLAQEQTVTLTQIKLAQLAGLQRTSVCAAMATLQHAGALKVTRGRIRLQDYEVLRGQACGCGSGVLAAPPESEEPAPYARSHSEHEVRRQAG